MVQDIIQFTRLADITPTKRGNLLLLLSAGTNCFVTLYWLVSIHNLLHVILSEAKNLCGPCNYEILRRLAPQNDTHKRGLRMDTIYILNIV
jgi:hypothetical protein